MARGNAITLWPADLYDGCLNREMVLWLALEDKVPAGCMIGMIAPRKRATLAVVVVLGGADFDNWLRFEPEVCAWAAENGAQAVEFYGRKGWEKRAAPMGYKVAYTVYRKMLDGRID